jgi:hypothetical protein
VIRRSIRRVALTIPAEFAALRPMLGELLRYVDELDIRSDRTSFRADLELDPVTDRVQIGGAAKVLTQRVLPTVSAGGRLSVQDIQPLSALSGTTTIDVAPHTVTYGFGVVAYSGGTIIGLMPDTLYYVYADDDDIAGGAVSYFATTSPVDVAAANGRYFVGSIRTPASADVETIVSASRASPCVVVFSTAGFTSGNEITITGPLGMTELEGLVATLTMQSATSAKLDGVDSRLWGVYTANSAIATRTASSQAGSGGAAAGGGGKSVFLGGGF